MHVRLHAAFDSRFSLLKQGRLYKTGVHGMKGVSCADCHMPYTQEGAVKYSDHQIGSPLHSMDRSCMPCHRESEDKLRQFVAEKLVRKEALMEIAMDNLAKAHLEAGKAWELGAQEEEMKPILTHLRHGQWRWDYSIASHGSWFHAPEETLRLLSLANEQAQQARLKLVRILGKYGAEEWSAPDFDTKEKAQQLAGVPLQQLVAAKKNFKKTLEEEWKKRAIESGNLNPKSRVGLDASKSSYDTGNEER
jgi:nitrite reductase (cytochrome c-552)